MKLPGHTYTILNIGGRGLRLVHRRIPGANSGIFGVAVRAGSRDEPPGSHGLAHFVEHTIFKGTQRRSAWHIINRMEAVGGELNAFTTKEETVVYTVFPNGSAPRAVELVADLILNSRFPQRELDKERDVVADEIDSYLDTPSEAVFDDFEDLIFAGHPLGHNILGTRQSLQDFDSETCRSYLHRYYRPGNMVAFYCGPQGEARIRATVEKHFEAFDDIPADTEIIRQEAGASFPPAPFHISRDIGSHQAHTVMGIRTGGMFSPERYAVALTGNIIGGPGMNSLLNVALREKRGLVYSVESSISSFTDTGLMSVYFGCDPDDTALCMEICHDTFRGIASGKILTRRAIAQAGKQYTGQLVIASGNHENDILSAARATLFRGRPSTARETAAAIASVTEESVRCTAAMLADPSSLTLGR